MFARPYSAPHCGGTDASELLDYPMAERDFEQENLFKEIDEDLRQEKYAELWKKYGNYLIGLAVLLVASVGGFKAWESWDLNRRSEQSVQFSQAQEAASANRIEDALKTLDTLGTDGDNGYALLARFNQAGLMATSGNIVGSVQRYLTISADTGVDQIYRDLASLLATLHELDRGDAQLLVQRLDPLTAAANPWRHTAKEFTALLARREGDNTRAGKLFRELADDATAPPGMRARAAELSAILGG
jgi:hypothetical protein